MNFSDNIVLLLVLILWTGLYVVQSSGFMEGDEGSDSDVPLQAFGRGRTVPVVGQLEPQNRKRRRLVELAQDGRMVIAALVVPSHAGGAGGNILNRKMKGPLRKWFAIQCSA